MTPSDLPKHDDISGDTTAPTGLPRRTVLSVGVATAAGLALAACGQNTTGTEPATQGNGQDSQAPANTTPQDAGPAAEIPVGGAAIVPVGSTAYVVAQPREGEYIAHSAVCPHQGCLCNRITNDAAVCPCHGSRFNVETGAVLAGPAKTGLAPASVQVADGQLIIS